MHANTNDRRHPNHHQYLDSGSHQHRSQRGQHGHLSHHIHHHNQHNHSPSSTTRSHASQTATAETADDRSHCSSFSSVSLSTRSTHVSHLSRLTDSTSSLASSLSGGKDDDNHNVSHRKKNRHWSKRVPLTFAGLFALTALSGTVVLYVVSSYFGFSSWRVGRVSSWNWNDFGGRKSQHGHSKNQNRQQGGHPLMVSSGSPSGSDSSSSSVGESFLRSFSSASGSHNINDNNFESHKEEPDGSQIQHSNIDHNHDGDSNYNQDHHNYNDQQQSQQSQQPQQQQHHRRLKAKVDKSNLCTSSKQRKKVQDLKPSLPAIPMIHQITYAASFPGSGDKLLCKTLVEKLTGMYVGEASVSPRLGDESRPLQPPLGQQDNDNDPANDTPIDTQHDDDVDNDTPILSQGRILALRTSFPHTTGKLSVYDDSIPRAFVLLRNPLRAIPAYFDAVYEMRNHLPAGTSATKQHAKSTHDAWVQWRDGQLRSQILLYRRFVSFWMEKFEERDEERIFVSYESLMMGDYGVGGGGGNELVEKGVEEVERLAKFLGEGVRKNAVEMAMANLQKQNNEDENENLENGGELSEKEVKIIDGIVDEAMKTMVPWEDIPCVWDEVVNSVSQRGGRRRRRRRLGEEGEVTPANNDNVAEWLQVNNRPFTPENLMAISQMLLELMNRWSRHQRVLTIIAGYHREVNRAYLEVTGQLEHAIQEREALKDGNKNNPPLAAEEEGRGEEEAVVKENNEVALEEELTREELQEYALDEELVHEADEIALIEGQHHNSQGEQVLVANNVGPAGTIPHRSFHIFQASQPKQTGSVIAVNWLMGLFEPEQDIAFMENKPDLPVLQNGRQIALEDTIVTKTHNIELTTLYNRFRPAFEEIFFVVTMRSNDENASIHPELCKYKNVLCIEYSELRYDNLEGLKKVVANLSQRLRSRFAYFFGDDGLQWLTDGMEASAVRRLEQMEQAKRDMETEPFEAVHFKFGVNGRGRVAVETTVNLQEGESEGGRRRLSVALPNGGCDITWPQPPQGAIMTAYAASYPGCGARMTWNLIEALTGLWTGDDWDNNHRGKRVVTVKTHYPHDAGKLVSWDNEIKRALVIIRNPMGAIPSFFNHIYEIKNHLPIHSERAPVEAWIEWRDKFAENQVMKYGKFVDYWMERFDKFNKDRPIFSYEALTDYIQGPEEAIRMTQFLAQSKGVVPIEEESVPCVWRAVVKYKDQIPDANKRRLNAVRRRLDPSHHDSQRSGPTERPYTPEQLLSMVQMLDGLLQKWSARNTRLKEILEGYLNDVNEAYLVVTGQISPDASRSDGDASPHDLAAFEATDTGVASPGQIGPFHIIQASMPHDMGSIVLTNILMGVFEPNADIAEIQDWPELPVRQHGMMIPIDRTIVSRTTCSDILRMYKKFRPMFDEVFFVISNSGKDPENRFSDELCEYSNVLCLEQEELVYTNKEQMAVVARNVIAKFRSNFDFFFGDNPELFDETKQSNAISRLEAMSEVAMRIQEKSFDYVDGKYGVHGGVGSPGAVEIIATAPTIASPKGTFDKLGKSFHIFQASPPGTASVVVTNWLMGLFEPDQHYSFMVNQKGRPIRHRGEEVPADTTIVTQTHYLDLMKIYKRFHNDFDEVFFVVSNRGDSEELRINPKLCEYNNVLCLEYEDLMYANRSQLEAMVQKLTAMFQDRFGYFFGENSSLLGAESQMNAIQRLEEMDKAVASLSSQPASVIDKKFGVHGGHRSNSNLLEVKPLAANEGDPDFKHMAGDVKKSFHVFAATPPHTASTVLTNWIMGIFEPEEYYSFMVNTKGRPVLQNGVEIPISKTIVTKTHYLDLLALYKRFRKEFDEGKYIFFVVSNRGTDPETRIDYDFCEYNNVLCIEYDDLVYSNNIELELMVQKLTRMFQDRFEYFFGANSPLLGMEKQKNAVQRLKEMDEVTKSMADQTFDHVDQKFGVHGGHRNRDGSESKSALSPQVPEEAPRAVSVVSDENAVQPQRKMFYCGGWKGQTDFKYSTFGLVLAKSLFPELKSVRLQPNGNIAGVDAIPLLENTIHMATKDDLLIMHSHQYCEIRLWRQNFPGIQLHINTEAYDLHPLHITNPDGAKTYNYLPDYGNAYIIGPHKDTDRSIRIPYCAMRLWFLEKTRSSEQYLPRIIDPARRPKNTREKFLIYANSHYVEYRERAALALSEIGTVDVLGKCQGNFEAHAEIEAFDETVKCLPFEEGRRPAGINVIPDSSDGIDRRRHNIELLSNYRFALVMENTAVDGYITEKIVDAFLSGAVPVYYGSRTVYDLFNPNAFVFYDVENPQKALSRVRELEENPKEYEKVLNAPLLAKGEETVKTYFSWDETVGEGELKKRIRKMIGFDP